MVKSEEWKSLPEPYSEYSASNLGRIQSNKKAVGVIMAPAVEANGYLTVFLYNKGKKKKLKVHRLVLAAFEGESTLNVNHKNGDKEDNRLENLEYCSRSENVKHAYKKGLIAQTGKHTQLSKDQVLDIFSSSLSAVKVAKKHGIATMTASNIRNKKTWAHVTQGLTR